MRINGNHILVVMAIMLLVMDNRNSAEKSVLEL